jgi:hypothetical protein
MIEEKQITMIENAPAEWGDRTQIKALATRLQSLMPGNLTQQQALSLAQYAAATDANPFRGEVYAYEDRGKLQIVDGYKLLVRWARRQCNFYSRYEPIENLQEGDVGARCWLLREDAKGMLQMLVECGATWREAFETAATSTVGVIRKAEMWSQKYNKAINPPNGWTWEQVAEKRALKNAINRAYGTPSPREIAAESWKVGALDTEPSDWVTDDVTPGMSGEERARLAAMHARDRERESVTDPEETLQNGHSILRGDPEDEWDEDQFNASEKDQAAEYAQMELGAEIAVPAGDLPAWAQELRAQADTSPGASDPIAEGAAGGLVVGLARKLDGDKDRVRAFIRALWGLEPEELTKAMYNLTVGLNGELAEKAKELAV